MGGTEFSLLRWEKGSETPSCGGEKGLRLPRSSCSDLGNEGVSDPFFPPQEGVSDPFSHRKRENPVPPKIPLAKIPLAQAIRCGSCVVEDRQSDWTIELKDPWTSYCKPPSDLCLVDFCQHFGRRRSRAVRSNNSAKA